MWTVDGGTEREYGGHAGDRKGEQTREKQNRLQPYLGGNWTGLSQ